MPRKPFCLSSRLLSLALLSLSTSAVVAHAQSPRTKPVTQAEVDRITRDAILIDTHNDVTSRTVDGYDIATPNKRGQTDLPRMKAGHLGAEFFAVYVGAQYVKDNQSAHRALQMIDTVRTDVVAKHPNDFVLATTAADIERAHHDKKIAALMGIEGGHAIENSLRLLRDFYALGVRYMTLTHFNTNDWADSQGDVDNPAVKHHNGLTPFGKGRGARDEPAGHDGRHLAHGGQDVLRRAGGEHGSADCIALGLPGSVQLHAQHDGRHDQGACRKGWRGADQHGLRLLVGALLRGEQAAHGGAAAAHAGDHEALTDPVAREAAIEKLREDATAKLPPATLADVVAQIMHAVEVGGVNAVGIGTDFRRRGLRTAGAGRV